MRTADPSADGRRSAAIFAAVELPSAGAYRLAAPGAIRCHSIVFAKCANVHGVLGPGQSTSISIGSAVFAQLSCVPGATENARREIAVYNQKSAVGMTRRERKMRHSFVGGGGKCETLMLALEKPKRVGRDVVRRETGKM